MTAINEKDLSIAYNLAVNYDKDLPKYKTCGGMHKKENSEVTSPTLMWVEAFDLILAKMKKAGFPF